MKVVISLQKRGFAIETPVNGKRVNWDALTEALLNLPNVSEVDGPMINGVVGVTYDDDDRPDEVLIAEMQRVCSRFIR